MVSGENTACAWLGGHCVCYGATAGSCHALITQAGVILRGCTWVAHGHTETLDCKNHKLILQFDTHRWESFDSLRLQVVFAQIKLSIVNSKPTLGAV